MDALCCDHCGKPVDIYKTPFLFTVWKRFPRGELNIITVCEDCEPLFARYSGYCANCGKEGKEEDDLIILHMVLRSLPSGEKEELYVCKECKPLFDDHIESLFTILGGPTYTDENRPLFWRNPVPLDYRGFHPSQSELTALRLHQPERYADVVKQVALDPTRLPLDDFPLIEDCEIILQTGRWKHRPEEQEPHYDIFAFSPSLGYLALLHLMSVLPQDLCQSDFIIPHGDFALPYADLDQGWEILLAENERFVYILTGNGEMNEGYTTWFKVEKSQYYSQWKKTIQLCRVVCQGTEVQRKASCYQSS